LNNKLPSSRYRKYVSLFVCKKQLDTERTCLLLVTYKLICMIEGTPLHSGASKLQIPK